MKTIIVSLLCMAGYVAVYAQETEASVRRGNILYKRGEFNKSLPEYQKALEQSPNDPVANYNFGNALFRNNNFEKSAEAYDKAIEATSDNVYKERSYYNKGVSYSKQKKLLESIEAYKEALKLDPNDADARHNLQKALYELKKQNESKKENENKENEQKQKPEEQQKQKPKEQQSKLNKRQVENLLKALQQREQEVQKKMQQNRSRASIQPDKDW